MKISQDVRAGVERKVYGKKNKESKRDFNKLVQSKSRILKLSELDEEFEEISKQGERIARVRSFKDLAAYKRLIRNFLQKTVYNGLEVNEAHHFSAHSSNHKLITVQKIDEKLVQLTEDLMEQEKQSVDILGLIGEINGLLVNLYR